MSDSIIKAEGIGKKYILSHQQKQPYYALRDVMADAVKNLGRKVLSPFGSRSKLSAPGSTTEEFWALKDISFEIKAGDRVGIIGRNGAGKSTLLKILSRITEPTKGRVDIWGRVSSLLEVGTGFHPELTGRENIYLNGAILGMSRAEIKKKFDEIVDFAEVEKFLDTPVKRYSSGMYVRLAFAVAAHLEPEILVIDEVLAVGDAQFQKKCLGKMQDVSAKEGRTVLFVSHNMQAIHALCNKGIYLKNAQIDTHGHIASVVDAYLGMEVTNITEHTWNDVTSAPGNDSVKIKSAKIIPDTTPSSDIITVKTPLRIEYVFDLYVHALFFIGFHLKTVTGECVFVTASTSQTIGPGEYKSTCFIPGDLLNNGTYTLETYFVKDSNIVLYKASNLLVFDVHDVERESGSFLGEIPGAVRPKLSWQVEAVS